MLPSHENYRNVDSSINDHFDLDEAEPQLQYLVQVESFNSERKDLLENKFVKRICSIAQFSPFVRPNGLILLTGRIKSLVKADFDLKFPIVPDARYLFLKLFLWNSHFKNYALTICELKFMKATVPSIYDPHWSMKSNSVKCRELCDVIIQPIMADLPVDRLACQSFLFTNTRLG